MARRHGFGATYAAGCRCEPCKAAGTTRQASTRTRRRQEIADGTADVEHGLASTYENWGCRCKPCAAAKAEKSRAERAQRVARLAADPTIVEHGKESTHRNWGCNCRPCLTATATAARRTTRLAARR